MAKIGRPNDGRTWEQRLSDAVDRVESRLDRSGDCWLWPGATNGRGYGTICVKTGEGRGMRTFYVHRLMYERHVGPIAEGLQIDHTCSVRLCARPDHLEQVTVQENIRRWAAAMLTCRAGHPYSEWGYTTGSGYRRCRLCTRRYVQASRARARG